MWLIGQVRYLTVGRASNRGTTGHQPIQMPQRTNHAEIPTTCTPSLTHTCIHISYTRLSCTQNIWPNPPFSSKHQPHIMGTVVTSSIYYYFGYDHDVRNRGTVRSLHKLGLSQMFCRARCFLFSAIFKGYTSMSM